MLQPPAPKPSATIAAPFRAAWPAFSAPWLLPGALVAATLASFLIDCQLAQWITSHKFPSLFRDLLFHGELFGHGLGLLLVVILICQFDRARRPAVPQLLACTIGAGMAANLCKLMIARTRPNHFDFAGGAWTTFGDWLPILGSGSTGQSFASAHTANAVALAMALAMLYPAARKLFVTLAVLTACNRLYVGAHYLSDVFCGALIGVLVGRLCQAGRLSGYFRRVTPPASATEPCVVARDNAIAEVGNAVGPAPQEERQAA